MPGWVNLSGIFVFKQKGPVMIRYKLAGNEHFDELLDIVYHQEETSLKPILDLTQLTSDQFGRLFRSRGVVYRILVEDCLAGLCWVEACGPLLQIHSLILRESFRGQGIGTRTLEWLENFSRGDIEQIELKVHCSNPRAKALYERCGYRGPDFPDRSGFFRMQKKIRARLAKGAGIRPGFLCISL
jgi:GNAT superfamily N-acetyltransferase